MDKMTLRPDQLEGVNQILADKNTLCADDLGVGKTIQGVESAIRAQAGVKLIVAPLITHTGWAKTIHSQCGEELRSINSLKAGKLAFQSIVDGEPGWYFVGWEMMRNLSWKNIPVDFLIADEVARATARKARQTLALKTIQSEYKLGLSATPFGNKIEGAWSVLNWLWPDTYKYFWPFVGKYLKSELFEVNGFKTKKISGEKEPGKIVEEIPSWLRREAPYDIPLVIHDIEVAMLPAQKKIYDRFEAEGVAWLGEFPLAERLPAVQYIRLREIALAVPSIFVDEGDGMEKVYFEADAKSAKIQALIDVLADLPEDEPHLVWTHSAKIVPIIVARLQAKGYETRGFYGATPKDEREQIRKDFGTKVQIIVATIQTAGTGLDGFQDVCRVEHVLSLDDNRQNNTQVYGRLSRGGQKRTVNRFVYRSLDTLEVRQNGRLVTDQQMMDDSIDHHKQLGLAA